jgi:hypothetical protein
MCIGCMPTEKERQDLLIQKETEAKADAVKYQKIYILYNTPEGSISHISADAARASGITPIKYISFLQ